MNEYQRQLFDIISERPIAYNPRLAKLLKSLTCGVLLSQLLYWAGKKTEGEWFFKTIAELEEETALSRREQELAIKKLKELGLIDTKVQGLPAKRYFKLNFEKIYKLVCTKPPNCIAPNRQTNIAEITTEKEDIDISSGVTAQEGQTKVSKGNEEIDLILKAFKIITGKIPCDRKPRQVAQNIRQVTRTFIKEQNPLYRSLRGNDLTFDYIFRKTCEWYKTKDYAQTTEKLETFKLKMKVYLDQVATQLQKEKQIDETRNLENSNIERRLHDQAAQQDGANTKSL